MNYTRFALFLSAVLALSTLAATAGDAQCKPMFGTEDDQQSPLELTISVGEADLNDGIAARIRIRNISDDPYSLKVCPAMLLCCVKGLHPLIGFDDQGMGLCDVCTAQNPTEHEVFLPTDASFSFNVRIPANRLPEKCRMRGKKVRLQFCYELGNGRLVHSNTVQAGME